MQLPRAARRQIVRGFLRLVTHLHTKKERPFYPTGMPALRLINQVAHLLEPNMPIEGRWSGQLGGALCELIKNIVDDPDAMTWQDLPVPHLTLRFLHWRELARLLSAGSHQWAAFTSN